MNNRKMTDEMLLAADRQHYLLRLILTDRSPRVADATWIESNDQPQSFSWGDIEALGYGKTYRDDFGEILCRQYVGPNSIRLFQGKNAIVMKMGDRTEF
jgi:hypothetical protein